MQFKENPESCDFYLPIANQRRMYSKRQNSREAVENTLLMYQEGNQSRDFEF